MAKMNGIVIPMGLVIMLVGGLVGYGEVKSKVKRNGEDIQVLSQTPLKVAKIEEKVEGIEQDVDEIKMRLDKGFDELIQEIRRIQ